MVGAGGCREGRERGINKREVTELRGSGGQFSGTQREKEQRAPPLPCSPQTSFPQQSCEVQAVQLYLPNTRALAFSILHLGPLASRGRVVQHGKP